MLPPSNWNESLRQARRPLSLLLTWTVNTLVSMLATHHPSHKGHFYNKKNTRRWGSLGLKDLRILSSLRYRVVDVRIQIEFSLAPTLSSYPDLMKDTQCGILYLQVVGIWMSKAPCVSETSQLETHTDGEITACDSTISSIYKAQSQDKEENDRFCWGWNRAGQPWFYGEEEKSPLSWVFHVDKAQEVICDGGQTYTKLFLETVV